MSKIDKNIFFKAALEQVPRLLGQLNRNSASKSYGSFDRAYWHYRTNDISSARYQEAVLTLILLYNNSFEGNCYYGNKELLEWIKAAINFTISIQNKDGSFDEWYPKEGSFVCTAFVTTAIGKTLMELKEIDKATKDNVVCSLKKSADWLIKHKETQAYNQLSGSVIALHLVYLLTNNKKYNETSQLYLRKLIDRQSCEGWWPEYGGPDIGYLSLLIDYLSQYYEKTNSRNASESLSRSIQFISFFKHGNYTSGGTYMSRNTEYLIPSGFARMAKDNKIALDFLMFIQNGLFKKRGVIPSNFDDRYICYILYNWLETGLLIEKYGLQNKEVNILSEYKNLFFKDSAIKIINNDVYYFVCNLYKGGSFHFYLGDFYYIDSGIELLGDNCSFISNHLDVNNKFTVDKNTFFVEGKFKKVKEPLMTPLILVLFRSFQILLGRFDFLNKIIKKNLRNKMITKISNSGIHFKRKFEFGDNFVSVTDVINKSNRWNKFNFGSNSSYNFIPSSRYFSVNGLIKDKIYPLIEIQEITDSLIIKRRFNLK